MFSVLLEIACLRFQLFSGFFGFLQVSRVRACSALFDSVRRLMRALAGLRVRLVGWRSMVHERACAGFGCLWFGIQRGWRGVWPGRLSVLVSEGVDWA